MVKFLFIADICMRYLYAWFDSFVIMKKNNLFTNMTISVRKNNFSLFSLKLNISLEDGKCII